MIKFIAYAGIGAFAYALVVGDTSINEVAVETVNVMNEVVDSGIDAYESVKGMMADEPQT